jgi:hypothetical protein
LPLDTRFKGSNPGKDDELLMVIRNLQHDLLHKRSIAIGPMLLHFMARRRTLEYEETYLQAKFMDISHQVSSCFTTTVSAGYCQTGLVSE